MHYINIQNGFPLRDQGRNGKGHLHAVVGAYPDGAFVEQSRDHGQIIQRVLLRNGELVVTCFDETDGKIKKLDEVIIHLWGETEGNYD